MQKTIKTEKSVFKPEIFRCNSNVDNAHFQRLVNRNNPLIADTLDDQLLDLVACLYPQNYLGGDDMSALVLKWLNGREKSNIGNWVYFPWKNLAVKVLEKDDFIVCRTNRNKLKITAENQDRLSKKSILFVGLSVGQSAALTFAMQRIGGTLHLADFDTLSLSNMNRLRAGIGDIGIYKCHLAARQIAEQDPYIDVNCITEGVTKDNIDSLLTQNGRGNVDLVVEECDSLAIKLLVRERAKHYGIPVIMETSDRGVVDIERFDLEPQRILFHGLAGDISSEEIEGLGPMQRMEVLTKIVDYPKISEGLKKSYAALGKEVLTWPQLGYEVTLGGATLAFVAGKILSGQTMNSGRIYVDLDTIFNPSEP